MTIQTSNKAFFTSPWTRAYIDIGIVSEPRQVMFQFQTHTEITQLHLKRTESEMPEEKYNSKLKAIVKCIACYLTALCCM